MISAKKTPEKSRFPIHYLVWHNKHRQLEKELATNTQVSPQTAFPPLRHRPLIPACFIILIITITIITVVVLSSALRRRGACRCTRRSIV